MQDVTVTAGEENTEIGVPGEPEPETPPSEGEPPPPPVEPDPEPGPPDENYPPVDQPG